MNSSSARNIFVKKTKTQRQNFHISDLFPTRLNHETHSASSASKAGFSCLPRTRHILLLRWLDARISQESPLTQSEIPCCNSRSLAACLALWQSWVTPRNPFRRIEQIAANIKHRECRARQKPHARACWGERGHRPIANNQIAVQKNILWGTEEKTKRYKNDHLCYEKDIPIYTACLNKLGAELLLIRSMLGDGHLLLKHGREPFHLL